MENTDLILKTLKDSHEPLKSQQIADLTGIDKKEVDKSIKTLKDNDMIASPKRCYYMAK